ncbi:DUF2577 domain-containing protein [Paenibacillus naphthalenovorans]|uniref:DUF2577 domain-containing protein n=1 Tax=Paenibacillus naphthalenovorans TaxID=162209 RepID=UPI00088F41B8|nr:DUF2577 domain-containing protein [Paenibacillus naphthalenovorans]SDJ92852.1 Protein of unknown function [Paenibacillus naphthalenovorans]
MSLNDRVKKITRGYLGSVKLSDVMFAEVTKVNPLEVNADQRLPLDEDFLIIPEHMTEYKIMVGAQEVTVRRGLEVGDKVILIRQQGGLNFVIVGRLTE